MEDNNIQLTNTEWSVMECFWDESPRTAMQVVKYLSENKGWAKSTTMTMLGRMEKKGLITAEVSGKHKVYTSSVKQGDAIRNETNSFLDKVYKGSVGMMINAMVNTNDLSDDDINELYDTLKKLKEN